jgi:hypothetical protein
MSDSEDSEVDENHARSPSFTSHQPAQIQSLAPASDHFSDPKQLDIHSELPTNAKHDQDSDDSFLSSSDHFHEPDVEKPDDHEDSDKPVDPFAAEDTYYTRPNRYYGPASTWRSWTKADRDVAESLDVGGAQDLSIHLYNAHVIRLQAQQFKESSHSKRRPGTSKTVGNDHVFNVPRVWMAWPMPPNQVPRDALYPAAFDTRPSKDLEECLISTTTKTARERWNARGWEENDKLKEQASTEAPNQQAASAIDLSDHDEAPEMQRSGPNALSEDERSLTTSDDDSADNMYGIDPTAKPVPLADDDKARSLLLPSTRHIISNLDHLLLALHRARQSYALPILTDNDDKAARCATDAESQSSASSGKCRRRSRAQRAPSACTIDTAASASTSSSKRRKGVWKEGSVPRNRKFIGLGLRDWSNMLGMAALTGWDEDVLARAGKRCAKLFGEDMLFRTFHEAEHAGEKSFFTERLASGEEPSESGRATYSQIPRTQETDQSEDSQIEATADLRHPCPVETCPRHKTPFHTAGNLKQHMTRNHGQFGTEDRKGRIVEAAMHDGREVVCPVQTCHRSREPFTRGPSLYLHVRKNHPEVNVEDLKKLESQRRGENRGKWRGEKRKRNPYERA